MILSSVQTSADVARWHLGDTVLAVAAVVILVAVLAGPRLLRQYLDAKRVIHEAESFVLAAERETQR